MELTNTADCTLGKGKDAGANTVTGPGRGAPVWRPMHAAEPTDGAPCPPGYALALVLPALCRLTRPASSLYWHTWAITLTVVSTTWRLDLRAFMRALLSTRPASIARQLHQVDASLRWLSRGGEGAQWGRIRIFIAPPIGPTIIFQVSPRNTGQVVMDQITIRSGVMQRHFCLLFNGRRVPADIPLQHLGVRAGDTIRTAPRLRGGARCPPSLG